MAGLAPYLQLLSLQGLQLALGQITLTWSGTNISAPATLTHGLNGTPKFVAVFAFTEASGAFWCDVFAVGATTFKTEGFTYNSAARTASETAAWIAIG